MIPFNKPYLSGNEMEYMKQAVASGKISCNGVFTKKCEDFIEKKYGFKKALLTNSCTHALEMAALLLEIKPGDEIIIPSFTYVSGANAFALRGATLVFADSEQGNPNADVAEIEKLITPKTKAVLVVHYAGIACDMEKIMELAAKHNLFVVEDAAHAIDSFYTNKPLGSIGHLAAFSFHETKNIISGEGGMLLINDERFLKRAEIVREKGTNRSAFLKHEVSKYEWVDIGSSYMPSELIAAYLLAQLENLPAIQNKRKGIWGSYFNLLKPLQKKNIQLPAFPAYASNNAHIFYLVCKSTQQRNDLIEYLFKKNILAVFHYQALHKSIYFTKNNKRIPTLPQSEKYSDCLIRLPLYFELSDEQVKYISQHVLDFFENN